MNKLLTIIICLVSLVLPLSAEGSMDKQVEDLTKEVLAQGPRFSLAGQLQRRGSAYVINGERFVINAETKVFGVLRAGAVVEARGLISSGKKIASHVVVSALRPVTETESLSLAQMWKDGAQAEPEPGPERADGIEVLQDLMPATDAIVDDLPAE
ncbi:MAG: hypothetical protein KDD62_02895 [Bdellovibrionales bacterium]|nr:hypothetical protein [Bdellovibrionales bacterium]